ncbi:hypothetical protein FRB98_009306 [Tulasnella sp. 332]|nr:hypothetical protein FRB98_009306 [Tulasnella sp. 332]
MSAIAQYTVPAPLVTQLDKSDALAMPSIQSPGLVEMPSLTSFSAPEYAQMVDLLKGVIQNINEIIDLLNHPKENKPVLSELIYALATIRSFKVRVIECNHGLEAANATASAWLFSVSTQLAGVNKDLAQVQEHIHETEDSIAKNLQLIQDSIKTFTASISNMQERHMLEGSKAPNNQVRVQVKRLLLETEGTIMTWMPIIATALTIAEVSQDDEEVNATDSSALMNIATSLREQRQHGLRLEAEIASIRVTETEILILQAKLQATAQFLGPLKINFEHCIRAATAGFALSGLTNKVVDASASMEKARRAIKSLADALNVPSTYWGVFVTLSAEGCAELDERIKALRNKEPKPIPVAPAAPEPVAIPPQVPETVVVPPQVAPEIAAPQEVLPQTLPVVPVVQPPQVPAILIPQIETKQPEVPLTAVSHSPLEFTTALVSPISGWDLVGVHLVRGMNVAYGKMDGQPSATPSWELAGMHLVRPMVTNAPFNWSATQTQSLSASTAVSSPVVPAVPAQLVPSGNIIYGGSGIQTVPTQVVSGGEIIYGTPIAPTAPVQVTCGGDGKDMLPADPTPVIAQSQPVQEGQASNTVFNVASDVSDVEPVIPTHRQDGGFSETSKNIRLEGSSLQADCLAADNETYQSSSLDINEILGNDDGSFTFRFGGWFQSAKNINLDGAVLKADLRRATYGWNDEQTLDLDLHIANIDGALKLVNTSSYDPDHDTLYDITQDYKGNLISSLNKAVHLVVAIQASHSAQSDACQQLLNVLNQLLGLIHVLYANSTWFDHPPPNSLNQTLRRLRNWGLTASRSTSSMSEDNISSKVEAFTCKLEHTAREMTLS